jgi:hypothetical protein
MITDMVASLYDGGWRAEDKDELVKEYNLTEDEAAEVVEGMEEIEERERRKTPATRKQLHELLDLVLDINGPESTDKMNGKPTVFFSFSGHVMETAVEVFEGGWWPGSKADYKKSVYIDRANPAEMIDKLREIRAKIEAESLSDNENK